MKKLFYLAFAALAFTACSDDKNNAVEKFQIISFEESDGLLDIEGAAVRLGEIEVVGGAVAGTHQNVYWAKGGVFTDYTTADDFGSNFYDGFLCSTADLTIWFGTYYSDGIGWGSGQSDNWGGFALTRNYNMTATDVDFKNQFSAWASSGANGSKTCMVGYDSAWQGDSYALPTIEFSGEPRIVDHLYIANSTLGYTYQPSAAVTDTYYYKVAITAYNGDRKVEQVECELINGDNKLSGWKKISLRELGKITRLEFKPLSNDMSYGFLNCPAYFCIDQIALVRE